MARELSSNFTSAERAIELDTLDIPENKAGLQGIYLYLVDRDEPSLWYSPVA